MKPRIGTLLVLIALVAAASAPAQEPLETLGEVIDVRVVNLEVVVTDRRGNRVLGLGSDLFRLEVDGEEVPIEFFTEVRGGMAVAADDRPKLAGVPQLAPGEPVGTSYLVFVDESFSRPDERDRILDLIEDQLPNLLPEDRMAIVAYTPRGPEMLTSWTQSQEELEDVLDKASLRPAAGMQWEALLRSYQVDMDIATDIAFLESGALTPELMATEERAVRDIHREVDRVVLGAATTLRGFANPPGRKVMLLFSGGWPWDPAQYVLLDGFRASLASAWTTREELYAPLIDTANLLGYTLYTIEIPGARAPATSSVRTFDVAGSDVRRVSVAARKESVQFSLAELAQSTGGEAFLDERRDRAFEQVTLDTRSYYWLGFTPSWKGDDETHEIRVRMRDPGLEARYRGSYSDLSRQREVAMVVESTLLFGSPPSTLPLAAQLGKPSRSGRRTVTVPLSVVIPMSSLTFLPQGELWVARTELHIAAIDDEGNSTEIPVLELPLVLEQPPEPREFRRFDTEIRFRNRRHDVVVSLYDTVSRQILSSRLELTRH